MAGSKSEEFLVVPESGTDSEDYQAFLADYSHPSPPSHEGEVLHGQVLSVSDKEVIVDIGRKIEGLVPASQFPQHEGKPAVEAGDSIDVMIDRSGPQVEGYILLSYERAHKRHAWEVLEKHATDGTRVTGKVVNKVKGGLAVDIGVIAFLPGSQIELRPTHNLDAYLGRELEVRILKLNRRRANAVVSRRVLLEEEATGRKNEALAHISEGAVVTGVVKNLTDYGAFVDLGGIDGLLHVSDLSHGNVTHPSAVISVGETLTVKVLKFDREKERISLGLKQLSPDPWAAIDVNYPVQSKVIGRVVSVTDYGAFVELEPGVEGLIHISEMTWSRRMKHPSKVVKPGDTVESVVLEVNLKDRRISLGLKQLEANPWTTVEQRYSVGSVVEGRVRNMTEFGAFIEIEEGIDGLVHISDLSWTKRIKHPSEVLRKGSIVQAVILAIDVPHKRLSLGIKQLQPDAWETFFQQHHVNDTVHGKVLRLAGFGAFVEIAEGVEGLCHFSEVPGWSGRKADPAPLAPGQEMDFKIIKMNEAERKIGLSLKAFVEAEEKGRLDEYQKRAAAASSSLEDFLPRRDPR